MQEANSKVAMLANEAKEIWSSGNKLKAIEKLDESEKILHTTNLSPVHNLQIEIANADVSTIMSEAVLSAESGELDVALKRVVSAIAIPNATEFESANNLKKFLDLVNDSEKVKALLLKLPDEEFTALQSQGTIPSAFISGYEGLDKHLSQTMKKEVSTVAKTKEKLKREEKEKQRFQAEADTFVKSGVGKKVPYDKWEILGNPTTLVGTNNRYWIAYLEKANISFVSEKSSDVVIFAAFGKEKANLFIAEKDKRREEQLKRQFDAWDGSHLELTKTIKSSMNDPDSYKHVETRYWDMGDHLVVRTTFRGKNAFGGVVTNWVKAKVDLNGKVLEIIEQGP